jgi:glycosyltransferase involved in cell wall biosynthesis
MLTTSIAMATYNGARHIRAQLDSLANQTLPPLELVVTDDGSTDETLEMIADFARAAPFPVSIHRNAQKLGYKANFIKCAGLCRGDLVAFCDQDDVWDADKLARITEILDQSDALLAYHTFRLYDPEQDPSTGPAVDQRIEVGTPWAKVYGITEVFHRALLDYSDLWPASVDHFDPSQRMAHDQWIYFLAHAFGAAIYVPQDLINYRQHNANICGFQPLKTGNPFTNAFKTVRLLLSRVKDGREFSQKRDTLANYWEGLSLGAKNRAVLLSQIVERSPPTSKLQAPSSMIQYYQQLHEYYDGRFQIFSAANRKRRFSALVNLVGRGLYWRRGSRGLRDSVIDLIYGVLA